VPRHAKHAESCIGVISDTHGLLRPQAIEILKGCDQIIHAGDIGSETVLAELRRIAPVTAVRGNNDTQAWARDLLETEVVQIDGRLIYVIHDIKMLDIDPVASGISVVISGHSHKPASVEKDGVLYLNPGSAGPRRFNLPLSAAKLYVSRSAVRAEIIRIELEERSG
jgi:putative phosphoesterase